MRRLSLLRLVTSMLWLSPTLFSAPAQLENGSPWLDDSGRAINAHGGCLLLHEGTYFWYGEMKSGATQLPDFNASWGGTRVPFEGVSCYSSKDLRHWKWEANVLPANPEVRELAPDRVIERPKVLYNSVTRKFVMWMHADSGDYKEATVGVAESNSPTGPFRFLRAFRPNAGILPDDMEQSMRDSFKAIRSPEEKKEWIAQHPEWAVWARDFERGQMARDMSAFTDDDGVAFLFYASEENEILQVSRLDASFTGEAGRYRRILKGSREAPAPFKSQGRYFLATSGCTGWDPNPTRLFSADALLGEWKAEGDFFLEKSTANDVSYLSQAAFVAKLGDGSLLYLADRWEKHDLENSRYIWLPIDTRGEKPGVRWRLRITLPEAL